MKTRFLRPIFAFVVVLTLSSAAAFAQPPGPRPGYHAPPARPYYSYRPAPGPYHPARPYYRPAPPPRTYYRPAPPPPTYFRPAPYYHYGYGNSHGSVQFTVPMRNGSGMALSFGW